MEKMILIKELRSFFKLQSRGYKNYADMDNDSSIIKEILSEPNSGVVNARKKRLTITVTQGNEIVEISPNKNVKVIGKVPDDVKIQPGCYAVR